MFTRACTQCHGGADQTTAQPPVPHFQDIRTQCPRPVDTVTPPRFVFPACPERLARNTRTYEIIAAEWTDNAPDRVLIPGRALLTGFVGGPRPRTTGTSWTCPSFAGSSDRPVLPQQQRGYTRRGGGSLHGVLHGAASVDGAGRAASAADDHRWSAFRPGALAR